jgi:uncharacterized membrane protein
MNTTIETTLTTTKYFQNSTIHFMVYAGFSHLTFNRVDFQAQVPDWLPLSKDLVVLLSGSRNSFGSWISFLEKGTSNIWLVLALFFVLVFPGNIAQYLDQKMLLAL